MTPPQGPVEHGSKPVDLHLLPQEEMQKRWQLSVGSGQWPSRAPSSTTSLAGSSAAGFLRGSCAVLHNCTTEQQRKQRHPQLFCTSLRATYKQLATKEHSWETALFQTMIQCSSHPMPQYTEERLRSFSRVSPTTGCVKLHCCICLTLMVV